jgi:SAM-dependent methyltransferase
MTDVLGQAIYDYHFNRAKKLWIHNRYGEKEQMPVATYFRSDEEMPDLEWLAIERCEGKTLDIGAGAGSHSLLLQEKGIDITALDFSPLSIQVIQNRGVKKTIVADIFEYNGDKYDTLLMVMNGIGLAGNMENLNRLLIHFKSLLNEGGQVIFDSSDIAYMYEFTDKPTDNYYGEIWYQYEYKKQETDWFQWLYIDEKTMQTAAEAAGYDMEVLLEDENSRYLATLTLQATD